MNKRRGSLALNAWKREFHGGLQSELTKGTGDANVPAGASDLDYAQLPLRWLAPLDVAAFEGRALSSSVASHALTGPLKTSMIHFHDR